MFLINFIIEIYFFIVKSINYYNNNIHIINKIYLLDNKKESFVKKLLNEFIYGCTVYILNIMIILKSWKLNKYYYLFYFTLYKSCISYNKTYVVEFNKDNTEYKYFFNTININSFNILFLFIKNKNSLEEDIVYSLCYSLNHEKKETKININNYYCKGLDQTIDNINKDIIYNNFLNNKYINSFDLIKLEKFNIIENEKEDIYLNDINKYNILYTY